MPHTGYFMSSENPLHYQLGSETPRSPPRQSGTLVSPSVLYHPGGVFGGAVEVAEDERVRSGRQEDFGKAGGLEPRVLSAGSGA